MDNTDISSINKKLELPKVHLSKKTSKPYLDGNNLTFKSPENKSTILSNKTVSFFLKEFDATSPAVQSLQHQVKKLSEEVVFLRRENYVLRSSKEEMAYSATNLTHILRTELLQVNKENAELKKELARLRGDQ